MTQITCDHAEWAVVERLRLMLEEVPHGQFSVTQSYAFFTAILCWTMQSIRQRGNAVTKTLLDKFSKTSPDDNSWILPIAPAPRIVMVGTNRLTVPASTNFENRALDRILINLRDATAHGDARNVQAFNASIGGTPALVGFTFSCAELERGRRIWEGSITLIEADMRRIGTSLAKAYCDALRRSDPHHHDSQFGKDAASIKEVAA